MTKPYDKSWFEGHYVFEDFVDTKLLQSMLFYNARKLHESIPGGEKDLLFFSRAYGSNPALNDAIQSWVKYANKCMSIGKLYASISSVIHVATGDTVKHYIKGVHWHHTHSGDWVFGRVVYPTLGAMLEGLAIYEGGDYESVETPMTIAEKTSDGFTPTYNQAFHKHLRHSRIHRESWSAYQNRFSGKVPDICYRQWMAYADATEGAPLPINNVITIIPAEYGVHDITLAVEQNAIHFLRHGEDWVVFDVGGAAYWVTESGSYPSYEEFIRGIFEENKDRYYLTTIADRPMTFFSKHESDR